MTLKLDKKNRPYLSCYACGTRAFLHSAHALKGVYFLAPILKELMTKISATGSEITQAHQSAIQAIEELKKQAK